MNTTNIFFSIFFVLLTISPTDTQPLNNALAGTGTSTTDWVNLVVGEGGIIDWVVPGWRGEYKGKN